MILPKTVVALASSFLCATLLSAKEPSETIELWPDGVPGIREDAGPERIENNRIVGIHYPTLDVYLPDSEAPHSGTAIIFCPGGGYHHLTIGDSGGPETQFLNKLGITVFVLKYRMLEYGHPAPLQDTVHAIRTVRQKSADFEINPQQIGLLGASAGGHAAASAATLWKHPLSNPKEAIDGISGRPDFAILIYPVISMKLDTTHKGSRRNLIGEDPTAEVEFLLSLENQVIPETPPIFLVATMADQSVPVENTLGFYQSLRNQNVPAEMHVYSAGSHGNSLDPQYGPTARWPLRAEEWLRFNGWIH